ncbi:MAG: DUF4956 domain-containing protein [Lachnospiraceae bacterium]|nr:DUF4956 domain-containing protein [Lachnospiraceae bacterium]
MSFQDIFKKSFLEGYTGTLDMQDIVVALLITALIGMYIFVIYHFVAEKSFYSKSFNISLVAIAVITAAVILTIQNSIVVSLGMVGALSIVRFRTAVKEPLDLVFLFWCISVGIICGAGFWGIAVTLSAILTVIILFLQLLPNIKNPLLLVVTLSDPAVEENLLDTVEAYTRYHKIRSRSLTNGSLNEIIEVSFRHKGEETVLLQDLDEIDGLKTVSLLSHFGETFF